MPLKSVLWQHFEKKDNKTAICLHCGKTLKTSGNTTNLKCHMESRHSGICEFSFTKSSQKPRAFRLARKSSIKTCIESEDNVMEVRNKISLFSGDNESSSVCSRSSDTSIIKLQSTMIDAFQKISSFKGCDDQMRVTNTIVYMICKDAEPFSIVEHKGFKKLIKILAPNYSMPSKKVLKNLVLEKYNAISSIFKNKIREIDSCTLSAERWTDFQMRNFVILSAHFYEDDAPQHVSNCTLGIFETNHRQAGEFAGKNIKTVCDEWGISDEKVLAVVTDDEPDISMAVEMTFDARRQVPCFSHTLNLIGKRSIENVPEVQAFINLIRDVALWFKENINACNELHKCTNKKLIQNTPNQWTSSFYMLQRFLELWPCVNEVMSWNLISPAVVAAEQISELSEICEVLRPLEAAVRETTGDRCLTSSLVIPIAYCLQDKLMKVNPLHEAGKKLQRSLIIECEKSFRMIEDVQVLATATVLDPRFKKLYFKDAAAASNVVNFIGNSIVNRDAKMPSDLDRGQMSIFSDHNEIVQKKWLKAEVENQSDLPPELLIYLRAPAEKIQQDPLLFWKQMESTYPLLANFSRKYLSSCAACIQCNHFLSATGEVANWQRHHLRGDISLELLFLQNIDDSFWNF